MKVSTKARLESVRKSKLRFLLMMYRRWSIFVRPGLRGCHRSLDWEKYGSILELEDLSGYVDDDAGYIQNGIEAILAGSRSLTCDSARQPWQGVL